MSDSIYTKEIYDRETNSVAFWAITLMPLQTPLPYYSTKIIAPFLHLRISTNHDKGEGF